MEKKRKRKKTRIKRGKKPQRIIITDLGIDFNDNLNRIEYLCDDVFKYANISYLHIPYEATTWEIKLIIQWLERFHPNRTHRIKDSDYEDYLRFEFLGIYPDDDFIF